MKKSLSLLSLTMALSIFTVACGANNENTTGNNDEANNNANTNTEENVANNDVAEDAEQPAEITVEHELGETVVPTNPENVVVFDFGTLDTLNELGVNPVAIPQGNVPSFLSQYEGDEYENAGTLFEPDFETIYGLEPDLIIISGRTSEAYDELSEIAPTIHLGVDQENYVDSFKENATLLGDIFGKEAEVEEKLANIDEQIAELNEAASSSEETGLIVMTNEGALSAYGPGSRFGVLHDEFGVTPADENIEDANHGQNVSFEYVVETDPDYLFVIDRGAIVSGDGEDTAEDTLDNDLIQQTTAYEEGNIIYLDPELWYIAGGGLNSVSLMANEVFDGMQ
ncbi:siderophore ABC transporter substrate-binding protein [Salipaludibacillus sp. LMS25]|jgi:iron complex transport system substrate-binding protein|uniref:siderophore ABC transporter substrate-binding protein n=1 Tax=Salipaludibacillus sp. LMS25 TaxID=2924031 RepID=UPI0020D17527|nr:siderophore ABC transporter substrate-binding protein [Salipaludibacillus sp. LMS25]UTR13328.1 siderophore ABC transporter substrate-binding protein [Salipaludibacillus sp. LMS25]